MNSDDGAGDNRVRVKSLKRTLRVILPITAVLQIATIISIPAFPLLFLALVLPDIAGLVAIVLIDREILRLGGTSFWKNGRFHG